MDDPQIDILGSIPPEIEQLFEDAPEPEVVEEPQAEPEAEAPAPEPVETEAPAEGTPEVEAPETPAEEEVEQPQEAAKRWADKYESPEELENAYRHQVASATRLAQENASTRRALEEREQAIARVVPYLQQIEQERARQGQRPMVEDLDYTDPEQVQRFITEQVQAQVQQGLQQVTPQIQQQQQQMQEAQEHARRQAEFQSWQTENPDVVPGSDTWTAMNNVIHVLQYDDEQGRPVEENFPLNSRENLAIAKTLASEPGAFEVAQRLRFVPSDDTDIQLLRDAASNPALADHLEANPVYLESIKGHSIARQLAGMPAAVTQAQQNATTATAEAAEAQRKAAYVESDAPGTPAPAAPGQRPDDVWDLIGGDLWEQERSTLNR